MQEILYWSKWDFNHLFRLCDTWIGTKKKWNFCSILQLIDFLRGSGRASLAIGGKKDPIKDLASQPGPSNLHTCPFVDHTHSSLCFGKNARCLIISMKKIHKLRSKAQTFPYCIPVIWLYFHIFSPANLHDCLGNLALSGILTIC